MSHEKTDAEVGPLALLAVGVGLLVLVSLTGVAVMWRVMAYRTVYTGEMAGSPLAPQRALPPPPRLQTTPGKDLHDVRDEEAHILSTYGVVDKDKGVWRIPIDRAMDLLAERGLPKGKPEPPVRGAKQAVKQ